MRAHWLQQASEEVCISQFPLSSRTEYLTKYSTTIRYGKYVLWSGSEFPNYLQIFIYFLQYALKGIGFLFYFLTDAIYIYIYIYIFDAMNFISELPRAAVHCNRFWLRGFLVFTCETFPRLSYILLDYLVFQNNYTKKKGGKICRLIYWYLLVYIINRSF